VTLIAALLLVVIGWLGYTNGTPDPEKGVVSPTALIPAAVGAVLAVLGLVAMIGPGPRKHAMHVAAMVGLIGALGGFMPLVRQVSKTGEFDPLKPSAVSGELMILVCVGFLALCVNSFIQARVLRKATAPPAA
jgi:hypothetical protein